MIESVYEGIFSFRKRVSFDGNCVSGLVLSSCVWGILRMVKDIWNDGKRDRFSVRNQVPLWSILWWDIPAVVY